MGSFNALILFIVIHLFPHDLFPFRSVTQLDAVVVGNPFDDWSRASNLVCDFTYRQFPIMV